MVKVGILLAAVCAAGWAIDGSYKGAVAWLVISLPVWLGWRLLFPREEQGPRITQTEDFKEEVEGPSIRGERLNPDPTRPTTEDFAGMLTNYIERKRG